MKYEEALAYIDSIAACGIVPGLDSIKELCRRLGNPQDTLSFVHVAGTNGKGSTVAYLSTVLKCSGYRVGRYISPVIFEYRERIQVNGRLITKKAVAEGLEIIRSLCDQMVAEGMPQPTPFEVETALAFWYFKEQKCDVVVLETGMGGLLDATNLVETTCVSVLASIGMDHMQFLGKTLEDIAAQKAGIIKQNSTAVCMQQTDTVLQVVEKTCEEKNAKLIVSKYTQAKNVHTGLGKQTFDYRGLKKLEISMSGKYQIANACLAIDVLFYLNKEGFPIKESALRKGLKEAGMDGRFTIIGKKPLFIVDGAHNEDAAQKLAESIEFYFTNKRIIYIMGMLKDKECEKVIALTHQYADQIITVTPPENPRAMHAYDLAKEIAKVHQEVTAVDSLEEAVEISRLLARKEDVILAFGSLSYLGKLMDIVKG